MSANTKIEWADHTFNPWEGCQKVGPGCDHCYAENRNTRFNGGQAVNWGPGAPRRRTSEANWHQPLKWNLQAARLGIRYRVFCASLADVFDNAVDPQWRADLFELIAKTPNLDWLLLTKRIGNVGNMLPVPFDFDKHYPNVWLGATIVDQPEYDRDIGKLLRTPARVHFLSVEPMLGCIDMRMGGASMPEYSEHRPLARLDWVIVGGESGPGARPMHPDWARSLRDQCEAAGVPYMFKQWGEWNPGNVYEAVNAKESIRIEPSGTVHPFPPTFDPVNGDWCMHKVGKKAAGRLLDGRTWDGVPA